MATKSPKRTKTAKTAKTAARKTRRGLLKPAPTEEDIWQRKPLLIRQFLAKRGDYEQLCSEVEYILRKRLAERGIHTAAILSRAKALASFLEKMQRKSYSDPLDKISDLAGARVVCLYRSDIDRVSEVIRSEFHVVEEIDKLRELGVAQFGYGARHFVVGLGSATSGARYDDLKALRCEVQVRTVVQDAWAIIQHHMVYKKEDEVPKPLQRKMNSLAGLFEAVDDSFESIREEREAYLHTMRKTEAEPNAFLENELNLDSFKAYLLWRFPNRTVESWDGQMRVAFNGFTAAGFHKLSDVDSTIITTERAREAVKAEVLGSTVDREVVSAFEAALAVRLAKHDLRPYPPFPPEWEPAIDKHRVGQTPRSR
jgi:ppGpp synthetase/RelA/SpoT-type nucleotidyltranferase